MSVFDDKANEYDEWFRVNDQLFDSELTAVRDMLEHDTNYIEVGVGTGLFASNLGISQGVEPSAEMAKYATMRGIDVVNGTAQHLPHADGAVDGIVMITVDCFVKDISEVFHEINRVLRMRGSFVMAFLDRKSPLGECYEANKDNDDYYRDATFRSYDEMCARLGDAGFSVVDSVNTVFTLDNKNQPYKAGHGEGVFAIIKARKEI